MRIQPAKYLLAARALRDFSDAYVAVLLPVYLLPLGFAPLPVGILSTASLLGSALLTIGIGLLGARHDHRRLLLAAAGLMVATGAAFVGLQSYGPPGVLRQQVNLAENILTGRAEPAYRVRVQ